MRRPALDEGNTGRCITASYRFAFGRSHVEPFAELVGRDLADLRERLTEQQRRRVVVIDEHAAPVDEEHRRRQVRGQLPGQDQREALGRASIVSHGLMLARFRCSGPALRTDRSVACVEGGMTITQLRTPDQKRMSALRASGYVGPAYVRGRPAYEFVADMTRRAGQVMQPAA